jgi:hypothetical protein
MKSPAEDKRDQEIIELLRRLRSFGYRYPPDLLAARRAAFLAQLEKRYQNEPARDLAPEDQEIIDLLKRLKSAQAVYPPELLAARRATLLRQIERNYSAATRNGLRRAPRKIFLAGLMRPALALAGLLVAVFLGSLAIRLSQSFSPAITSTVAAGPPVSGPISGGASVWLCLSEDQSSCTPKKLDPRRDLARPANGSARPAVSKDALSTGERVHAAAYVNDGSKGASWISSSEDSWIKIDLGKVTTINTVSFQKGSTDASSDGSLGRFVISVALSDVYADGDSANDHQEYSPVFRSEPTVLSKIARAEIIQAQFPMVRARFVKITFEKAGAAIEEVGIFMVEPEASSTKPTSSPQTPLPTLTLSSLPAVTITAVDTATSVPTATREPTLTAASSSTHTPVPTDSPLPTSTRLPASTNTPVPIVPSETPLPRPTSLPPTPQPSPVSNDPIIVTGANQTLVFTCNGNAAEIRGHANTITLLGSCSSITVTGNGNQVFWQYGSPEIINRGNNNVIEQL